MSRKFVSATAIAAILALTACGEEPVAEQTTTTTGQAAVDKEVETRATTIEEAANEAMRIAEQEADSEANNSAAVVNGPAPKAEE